MERFALEDQHVSQEYVVVRLDNSLSAKFVKFQLVMKVWTHDLPEIDGEGMWNLITLVSCNQLFLATLLTLTACYFWKNATNPGG